MDNEQPVPQRLALVEAAPSPLTPKRQLFVRNYLSNGFNGAKAARDAGYAAASADREASRLLGFAGVQAAIKGAIESGSGRSPEELARIVTRRLLQIVRRDGETDMRELKALELLGKSAGVFDPRRQQPEQHLHLHGVSDEERRYMVARARAGDCYEVPGPDTDDTP